MLEGMAAAEILKKMGEAALQRASDVPLNQEMARQVTQQETFRVGEMNSPELADVDSLKGKEQDAVEEIRDNLNREQSGEQDVQESTAKKSQDVEQPQPGNDMNRENTGELRTAESVIETNDFRGGTYGELRNSVEKSVDGTSARLEVNHVPAKSVLRDFGFSEREGPAIEMERSDHRGCASTGSSREAVQHRQEQRELCNQGKFQEALQTDVDDIRVKYGDKYDSALNQAWVKFEAQLKDKGLLG